MWTQYVPVSVVGKKSKLDLTPGVRLPTRRSIVSNTLRPVAPTSVRTFLSSLGAKIYFPDTKANIHTLYLSLPILVGYGLNYYFKKTENKTGLEIMNKHFSANIENLENGRIHTLFTSYMNSASFWPALASFMMLFSFGGSIAKSHGAKFLYPYVAAAHLVMTGASLGLNYVQIKEVNELKKELSGEKPVDENKLYSIKGEKMKYMYSVGREMRKNGAIDYDVDKKQREVYRMEDKEFLDVAEQRYRERKANTLGGPLALNLLFPFIHPFGMMPMPFAVPMPWVLTNLTFTAALFTSNWQYAGMEHMMSLLALSPVVFVGRIVKKPTIYQFPGMNHNPTVPNGPINAATTAAANAAKQQAKATSNIPAEVAGDVKLTKEQIEAMKKRAQKFKKH